MWLMAQRPHSKSKTRMKIKFLILIFSVIFSLFHFTFILISSYFLITLLSFDFYFVLFFHILFNLILFQLINFFIV